jgi:hypothetical protein
MLTHCLWANPLRIPPCKLLRVLLVTLQELSVRECTRLSDEGLAALAANGALECLDVSLVPAVGVATMTALATFCRWLPSFIKRDARGAVTVLRWDCQLVRANDERRRFRLTDRPS